MIDLLAPAAAVALSLCVAAGVILRARDVRPADRWWWTGADPGERDPLTGHSGHDRDPCPSSLPPLSSPLSWLVPPAGGHETSAPTDDDQSTAATRSRPDTAA